MKTAILQVADQGPLESLVVMMRSIGYSCVLPNAELRAQLSRLGGLVLSPADLHRGMGYDLPIDLPEVGPGAMQSSALYVDVKAHQTYARLVERWPNLARKILWYRINGGRPEHVVNQHGDHGDEVNPPCPVLTPNQWYRCATEPHEGSIWDAPLSIPLWPAARGRAYVCWPPFLRFGEYYDTRGRRGTTDPICLIHNLNGWGYGALVDNMRAMGVRCYGRGSPDGLINHREIPGMLQTAIAMVHLKSNDAPGYAIYEAMAAGCPVICTRRLIWRCRMQELLIPNETCLVFDRETHDALTPEDVRTCASEVATHLERLKSPEENRRIGMNGYNRLKEIMWNPDRPADVESLRAFVQRNFG